MGIAPIPEATLLHRLAQCFSDARRQIYVDHSLPQLLAQRLSGLALGYEDLHDHQRLRLDPLLAAACDKRDPLGEERFNPAHRGVALAGASPLNRLELSIHKRTRAHKLAHDAGRLEACRLQTGVRCRPKYAEEIVVDLDAMGQRLLPGGDPGVVRTPSSGGRLLPGFGQALRAD